MKRYTIARTIILTTLDNLITMLYDQSIPFNFFVLAYLSYFVSLQFPGQSQSPGQTQSYCQSRSPGQTRSYCDSQSPWSEAIPWPNSDPLVRLNPFVSLNSLAKLNPPLILILSVWLRPSRLNILPGLVVGGLHHSWCRFLIPSISLFPRQILSA